MSKHLTCVSRIYSQPQPVNQVTYLLLFAYLQTIFKLSEFSLVQTPHLCLQDSLPTSACRDILKHFTKTCRFRQSIDKSHPSNDLTANMPKSETKHTSSESRILKLFDALDFTSAMYQPSVDCKSLVSAQHRPSAKNPGAQYKRSQLHLRWCP